MHRLGYPIFFLAQQLCFRFENNFSRRLGLCYGSAGQRTFSGITLRAPKNSQGILTCQLIE